MKKQQRQAAKSSARPERSSIAILVTLVIIAAAAITVVSRQLAKSVPTNTSAAKPETGKQYVTVKVAGRDVQVDPQTGQIRPMSREEAQRLADGLKTMLNKSTEGLVRERHADGSVSIDLKDRFQNVSLARTNPDGSVEQACVDEPEAAAKFLGLDPKLLGVERRDAAANSQPVITPSRKASR
jgi:hypothetical protein